MTQKGNKNKPAPASTETTRSRINEGVEEALKKVPLFPDNQEGVIEEAISVSSRSQKTDEDNLYRNFDRLWDDIRSIFQLLDKVGVTVAKSGEMGIKIKALLAAAGVELRGEVKEIQKDLGKFRKDMEVEIKELKKNQEELMKAIKDFKKMMDLYINPPEQMGPISRKTHQPFKGVGKE